MARLSIDESYLVAIGDALRVHFGENIEEGTKELQEGSPKSINTLTFIAQETPSNNFSGDDDIWPQTNPYTMLTYQIPDAARIELDITYFSDAGSYTNVDGETVTQIDYTWIAEGAHRAINENIGQKLIYTYSNVEDNLYLQCGDCGTKFVYDSSLVEALCPYCSGTLSVTRDYWTREALSLEGDTFSIALKVYAQTYRSGYWCDIYPYDADGNLLTTYDVIVNRYPNTYTVAQMPTAISKLNNYPSAKEVSF